MDSLDRSRRRSHCLSDRLVPDVLTRTRHDLVAADGGAGSVDHRRLDDAAQEQAAAEMVEEDAGLGEVR